MEHAVAFIRHHSDGIDFHCGTFQCSIGERRRIQPQSNVELCLLNFIVVRIGLNSHDRGSTAVCGIPL